jgi:hypothetical protein
MQPWDESGRGLTVKVHPMLKFLDGGVADIMV